MAPYLFLCARVGGNIIYITLFKIPEQSGCNISPEVVPYVVAFNCSLYVAPCRQASERM